MITLDGIEKVYRTAKIETLALNNINLQVEKGEFMAVMGPSGSGKSTLLNVIGLLDEPTKGNLALFREPVLSYGDLKLARIRNQKIGFIFQSYHLISDLNGGDNVEIPLLYRRISSAKRRKAALDALDRVGLSARTKHFPNQLSGGQCQRVAIARAIVGKPEIILADEPTGNLDSTMGGEIMNILVDLNQNEGTTVVMVTHDENLAKKTERIIRLFDGSIVN
jgi:putative ABC transport system ATP-binding protein